MPPAFSCYALSWRNIATLAHTTQDVVRSPLTSFVAFDEKTYVGETGWGVRGLYEGARITILYNSGNPAASHPLTSFHLLHLAINLMRTQCGSNALERAVTDSTD